MACNTHVSYFMINDKPLFVKHVWKEDDKYLFQIKVFYENDTWSGKFSNEMAANRRSRVDETEEEYANNVLECLNGDSNQYVFDFTRISEKENAATFIWKRQFEGALLVHGAVPLERDAVPESRDVLLQFILNENKLLKNEIHTRAEENNKLMKDVDRYRSELEDCIQNSDNVYSSLYSKFAEVLNKKKKRILQLKKLQQP